MKTYETWYGLTTAASDVRGPYDIQCGAAGCEIRQPHVCIQLPFDDDRDVTDAEKLSEVDIYAHGR